MESFTSQDITDFVKLIVEAGGGYYVDADNVIRREKTNDIWCIETNDTPPRKVKLVIYNHNQKDSDVIMVNPFIEGLQTSKELQWFYITKNLVVSVYLKLLYINIIKECLKVKANQELDSNIVKLISPYLEMVDDKMYAEIETITAKIHTFCDIYWNVNKKSSELKVSVLSENFRKSFGKKIRQKTWTYLIEVAKAIFGTDDPSSVYRMKSDNHGCAKFEAFAQVFLMVFKAYRPYFVLTPDFKAFDFEAMEKHISMIPLYYHRAKNLVSPAIVDQKKKAVTPANPPWKPVPVMATNVEYIPPAAPTVATPVIGSALGTPVTPTPVPVQQATIPTAQATVPAIPVAVQPMAAPTYMQPPISVGHAVQAAMMAPQMMNNMWGGYPQNPMVQLPPMPQVAAVGQMGAPYGNMPMMMGQQQYPMMQQPGAMPTLGQAMGTVPQQPQMYQQPMPVGYPNQMGYPNMGMQMQPNMGLMGMPQQQQMMPMQYQGMMPQQGMYPGQYPMQQQMMPASDTMTMSSIGVPIRMSNNPDNNRAAYKRG